MKNTQTCRFTSISLEEEYVSLHGPIRAGESVEVLLPRDEKTSGPSR